MQNTESIWSRRSLIALFAKDELRKRYRNSVLGFLWSVLEPLLLLSILVLVFSSLYRNVSIPHYTLYILLSLILWQFFVRGTTMGLNSILSKGKMVSKMYFPREILPLSSCITSLIMTIFELGIFSGFLIAFQFVPPTTVAFLPLLLFLEFVLIVGVSLGLSVLNVYYRDVQHIWGVVAYAGFFLTPIFYTLDKLPPQAKSIILLNPMAQIIAAAHNVTLYNITPTIASLTYTAFLVFVTLIVGFLIFRRLEPRVAEEI